MRARISASIARATSRHGRNPAIASARFDATTHGAIGLADRTGCGSSTSARRARFRERPRVSRRLPSYSSGNTAVSTCASVTGAAGSLSHSAGRVALLAPASSGNRDHATHRHRKIVVDIDEGREDRPVVEHPPAVDDLVPLDGTRRTLPVCANHPRLVASLARSGRSRASPRYTYGITRGSGRSPAARC